MATHQTILAQTLSAVVPTGLGFRAIPRGAEWPPPRQSGDTIIGPALGELVVVCDEMNIGIKAGDISAVRVTLWGGCPEGRRDSSGRMIDVLNSGFWFISGDNARFEPAQNPEYVEDSRGLREIRVTATHSPDGSAWTWDKLKMLESVEYRAEYSLPENEVLQFDSESMEIEIVGD